MVVRSFLTVDSLWKQKTRALQPAFGNKSIKVLHPPLQGRGDGLGWAIDA